MKSTNEMDTRGNDTQQEEQIPEIPFHFASAHGVMLDENEKNKILFRPGVDPFILMELRRFFEIPLHFCELDEVEFNHQLQQHYEQQTGHASQIAASIDETFDLTQAAQDLSHTEELLDGKDDAPVIRLINAVITQAIKQQASDIHIEPFQDRVLIRARVDGVLADVLRLDKQIAPLLATRLKVMAKLDIAEKRLPQDGRIALKIAGRAIDIRLSTFVSNHGERIVLRLLDQKNARLDLKHLGMPEQMLSRFEESIKQPHGIILVTGPTGSGKTTTLYAALTQLNETERNIMTVEDPVEYDLDGISQAQVNLKADLTFARGLRAILRQDPDVVMVGEIRDKETAEIAIQASLTGHLVFSTLHTNSAIGAITRLRDMGIEPFLLSSSITGLLAQRLVRTLCPQCKTEYSPSEEECAYLRLKQDEQITLYKATGCSHCDQRGYIGRTGIYEYISLDDDLRHKIHQGEGESDLLLRARQNNPSILSDAKDKILSGLTSLDEVKRVTRDS